MNTNPTILNLVFNFWNISLQLMNWPVQNSGYFKFDELILALILKFSNNLNVLIQCELGFLLIFMRIRLECFKLSSMRCFLNKQLLLIIIMVYYCFIRVKCLLPNLSNIIDDYKILNRTRL